MPEISKETKQRLQKVFKCGQFTIRWGFIPMVLYLGLLSCGADPMARVSPQYQTVLKSGFF
uniref:Mitochondrial import receptor subunit TOM7 homolog n=1 Tax=Leptobrachium leishanense TaxID=445787 RepID=A0A8C5P9R0_9ANUR